jgi:hypothetical protein
MRGMTDPARRARPVGPPPPAGPGPSGSPGQTVGTGQTAGAPPPPPRDQRGYYAGYQGSPRPPYMRVYRWSASGRDFPWFAILLLVLGIGLLIEIVFPALSFGALIILAAGIAFGAAWLVGHIVGATMPALVLTGWGLASIGVDVGLLTGDGWGTLFIGIAFLLGWALARPQGTRRAYALWIGLVLGVLGLADTADTLPFDVSVAVVIPLVMIALGVYLVWQSRILERR